MQKKKMVIDLIVQNLLKAKMTEVIIISYYNNKHNNKIKLAEEKEEN